MKKYLFIVEKPSIQKIIEKVYEENKTSLGYLADFVSSTKPVSHISDKIRIIDVTNPIWEKLVLKNIEIQEGYYIVNSEFASKKNKEIRALINSNDYDIIVNACDPGLYGQLSYEHVKEDIGFSMPEKRMWFTDLTDESVLKSLQEFKDNNEVLKALLKECKDSGTYY